MENIIRERSVLLNYKMICLAAESILVPVIITVFYDNYKV